MPLFGWLDRPFLCLLLLCGLLVRPSSSSSSSSSSSPSSGGGPTLRTVRGNGNRNGGNRNGGNRNDNNLMLLELLQRRAGRRWTLNSASRSGPKMVGEFPSDDSAITMGGGWGAGYMVKAGATPFSFSARSPQEMAMDAAAPGDPQYAAALGSVSVASSAPPPVDPSDESSPPGSEEEVPA